MAGIIRALADCKMSSSSGSDSDASVTALPEKKRCRKQEKKGRKRDRSPDAGAASTVVNGAQVTHLRNP